MAHRPSPPSRGIGPVPIPPDNYLIDFAQTTISPEGCENLRAAVANFTSRAGSKSYPQAIVGVAYADAPGSTFADIQVSQQRATAVADALATLGVPPDDVTINWDGEADSAIYPCKGASAAGPRYGGAKICVTGGEV